MLTRDGILAADDLPREKVDVPEWGGFVFVRSMTGAERDAWELEVFGAKAEENIRARFAANIVVNEAGQALFTAEDAKALGGKSAAALQRVFEAGAKLNALSPDDVKELEKN